MILITLLILVCTLLIVYIKWNFNYWQRQGIPYVKAQIPFGVLDSVFRRERSLGMAIYDVYKTSKERVLGIYLVFRPALLVRDAELARDILSTNFQSFHDRGLYIDEENDPMSGGLLFLKGKKWKAVRAKLSPSFTLGKLKSMFDTITDISNKMVMHLNQIIPDDRAVQLELKDLFKIYAIDIVGSVIFGLEVNSFKNPDNEFYKISARINEPNFYSVIRGTCQFLYPTLEKIFVRLGFREAAADAMKNMVRKTIEFREKHNVTRKDMLQLLLQLRNTGEIDKNDDVWEAKAIEDALKHMSVESIAAHLFLFYIAGYETTASSTAFTIYELSHYPDLLAKAQKDVADALAKHDGQLTYEAIQDMKFLDLCLMETIRKYPGLPILNRECTQDFPIPNSNMIITKGTPIIISLFGMQRDPEYFVDPLRYDPERFLEENMRYIPAAYMPFGEGPRKCIAQRMGQVNVKVALSQILTNFDIEINQERREIEIDNYGIPIMPKGGVNVRMSRKKTNNTPGAAC